MQQLRIIQPQSMMQLLRVSQLVIQIIHLECGLIQISLITVMNGCKQDMVENMVETKLFFQLIERAMELFM